jgi:autonomous glycyl radical cofactor GrcA
MTKLEFIKKWITNDEMLNDFNLLSNDKIEIRDFDKEELTEQQRGQMSNFDGLSYMKWREGVSNNKI